MRQWHPRLRPSLAAILVLGLTLSAVQLLPGAQGEPTQQPVVARTEGQDPWPNMLRTRLTARPSAVYKYSDVVLERDTAIQVPCPSARFCECTELTGWNRTFWLNPAVATYRGQTYAVVLQRIVSMNATIQYQQTGQVKPGQVLEANALLFCKIKGLTGAKPTVDDCQLIEPGPGYREQHPNTWHRWFNLLGLIDPRLVSAGTRGGLFLQVGCRPKALSDNYNVTRFKETLCLVKLQDASSPLPASASGAADGDDARRKNRARAVMRHRHRGMMADQAEQQQAVAAVAQQQQQQAAAAGGWWAGVRQALREPQDGPGATIGSIVLGDPAPRQAAQQAAGGGDGGDGGASSRAMQQQDGRAEAGRGEGLPSQEPTLSGSDVDPHVPPVPNVTITSHDWPLGQLTPLHYQNHLPPVEKNWVPFNYRGTLLWSRHLHPHQVVTVHANGTATALYVTNNTAAFAGMASICERGPRGNTPAVRLSKSRTGYGRDVYLGIMHWTPKRSTFANDALQRTCQEYLNFFYLMEGEPPFEIIEVSRPPIPLIASTNPVYDLRPLHFGMGYISFPTGMLVVDSKVIITYGSGDHITRVWRASLQDVLSTFTQDVSGTEPVNSTAQALQRQQASPAARL